jgi:hypothetical protein
MQEIKAVSVISFARIMGILYGIMGLLFLPMFLIMSAVSGFSGQKDAAFGAGIGLVFALIMPVIYGVMGFVMGALMAWIYNLVAGRWGGIELDLRTKQPPMYQAPV